MSRKTNHHNNNHNHKRVRLDVNIPEYLFRRIKSVAGASGCTMAELVANWAKLLPPTPSEKPPTQESTTNVSS